MAAWIVLGVVGWLVAGLLVALTLGKAAAMRAPVQPQQQPLIPDAMWAELLTRLMDATIPKREERQPTEQMEQEGEYIPPDTEIMDWTDPFIGVERPTVARLAPGQPIPFVSAEGNEELVEQWRDSGEGAFEEWARDTITPDAIPESWVEPITWNGESE